MYEQYHQPAGHPDELEEDIFQAELQASLEGLEQRLGIVALESQTETTLDRDTLNPTASHDVEDIDSVLDAAYGINQAYDVILEEGDKVYDVAAKMNEEHKAKQAAELRQIIDEALMELQQTEDAAESKQETDKESDKKSEIDNRKAEPKTDDSNTKEATRISSVMNPRYPKAVLAQARIAEPLTGQTKVDSATGEVAVTDLFDEDSLTVIHPQIGGQPTVTTYKLNRKAGELTIETNGVTTKTLVMRDTTGDKPLGRQMIKLPSSAAAVFGAKFVLAA